jgi:hypothetical protein
VTYTFQVDDVSRPVRITFDVQPIDIGLRTLRARAGDDDILEQARHWRAVERHDQVKCAILERSGAS